MIDNPTLHIFGIAFAALVGAWVMMDARQRGYGGLGAFLWGLGTFGLLCFFWPLWLLLRPAEGGKARVLVRPAKRLRPQWHELDPSRCPACGADITMTDTLCPSCGIHFGTPEAES